MADYTRRLVSPSTADMDKLTKATFAGTQTSPNIGTSWLQTEATNPVYRFGEDGNLYEVPRDALYRVGVNGEPTITNNTSSTTPVAGSPESSQSSFAGTQTSPVVSKSWFQTESSASPATTPASGGTSGSSSSSSSSTYRSSTLSPSDYTVPEMPVFAGTADPNAARDAYINAVNQGFSFNMPENYTAQYKTLGDSVLNNILNRQAFSYDYKTDPVYQAYAKQYAREGQRATADTMASAASMSGGIPSSYAVTAAQQTGDYYAAQMADKLPELYQQAYNRYLQEYQDQLSMLNAINNREELSHNIWAGNNNNEWKGIDMNHTINRDQVDDAYKAAELERLLRNDEHNMWLDEVNIRNDERDFGYGQLLDQNEWEANNENTAYERAWNEDERNYERSEAEYEKQLEFAIQMAEFGDTSYLEALGVDPTYYKQLLQAKLADLHATTAARGASGSRSGSSGSSGSGVDMSGIDIDSPKELTDEENAKIDEIYNNAMQNYYGGVSPEDWEYLGQYYSEEDLASAGLWKMTEEDKEGADEAADTSALMDAINQQYESQVYNPPQADVSSMTKALPISVSKTTAPVSGDQAAAWGTQGAATGKFGPAYGKSAGSNSISSAANKANTANTTANSTANTTTHGGTTNSIVPTVNDYKSAKNMLQSRRGIPETAVAALLTEAKWNKQKSNGNGVYNDGGLGRYDTYTDYINAYVNWAIEKYGI